MGETFGEWLVRHRKTRHLSQEQLAKLAKISKSYVGTLENARPHTTTNAPPQPDKQKVIRIASALGVSANEALLMAGYAPKESARELRVNVEGLTKADIQEIENFAEFKRRSRAALDAAETVQQPLQLPAASYTPRPDTIISNPDFEVHQFIEPQTESHTQTTNDDRTSKGKFKTG